MLTLGQAAKETGLSKTAISRAIKNGKLSAPRGENGEYQIDPAELFRVYPVTGGGNSQAERHATPQNNSGLQGQVDVLRELVAQVRDERDDLRRRLDSSEEARQRAEQAQDKAFAELSRLTLLLTHQPKPAPAPELTAQPPEAGPPTTAALAPAPEPQTGQQATPTKREKLREALLTLITAGGGGLAVLYVLRHFGLL